MTPWSEKEIAGNPPRTAPLSARDLKMNEHFTREKRWSGMTEQAIEAELRAQAMREQEERLHRRDEKVRKAMEEREEWRHKMVDVRLLAERMRS